MVEWSQNVGETVENDFESLCDTMMIERMITPLLYRVPNWSERCVEISQKHLAAMESSRKNQEIPPEQYSSELLELMGTGEETEDEKHRLLTSVRATAVRIGGFRISPKDALRTKKEFNQSCIPRTFSDWHQFATLFFFLDDEARPDLLRITQSVLVAMTSSIEAGHVACDIRTMAEDRPEEAFARCMTWLTDYLAWRNLAWPTSDEIGTFSAMYGFQGTLDQSQRTIVATWQITHPSYIGARNIRINKQHPFQSLLDRNHNGPLNSGALLLEVDHAGKFVGLCVPNQAATRPTGNDLPEEAKESAHDRSCTEEPSWADTLKIEFDEAKQTVWRTCDKYCNCPPVRLPRSQWELFHRLLAGGKNGVTRKHLADVLNTSEGAISTRKTGLKNNLYPLGLTIPGEEFRVADVDADH